MGKNYSTLHEEKQMMSWNDMEEKFIHFLKSIEDAIVSRYPNICESKLRKVIKNIKKLKKDFKTCDSFGYSFSDCISFQIKGYTLIRTSIQVRINDGKDDFFLGYTEVQNGICKFCNKSILQTQNHMLFKCQGLSFNRYNLNMQTEVGRLKFWERLSIMSQMSKTEQITMH